MTRNIRLAALGIPVLAAAFAFAPAHAASVTQQLSQCSSNSKAKTVDCCQAVLRKGRKPYWMGDKSCGESVSCTGGGGVVYFGAKTVTLKCKILPQPMPVPKMSKEPPQKGRANSG